jgi:hypothetical protein
MILSYVVLAAMIFAVIVGLIAGSEFVRFNFGERAAKQGLLGFAVFFLCFFLIILLAVASGQREFINAYFYMIFLIFGMIFFIFKFIKKNTFMGNLLCAFEKNVQNKTYFYLGITLFILQPLFLFSTIPSLLSNEITVLSFFNSIGSSLSAILFGIYAVFFANSAARLYENGISIMGNYILWNKITSYHFGGDKQNTFQAKYQSDFPLSPSIINLVVSEKDKVTLVEVLQQKLPHLGEIRAS